MGLLPLILGVEYTSTPNVLTYFVNDGTDRGLFTTDDDEIIVI